MANIYCFWNSKSPAKFKLFDSVVFCTQVKKLIPGALWSKMKTTFDDWEVDIMFSVNGRGKIGGDGIVSNVKM